MRRECHVARSVRGTRAGGGERFTYTEGHPWGTRNPPLPSSEESRQRVEPLSAPSLALPRCCPRRTLRIDSATGRRCIRRSFRCAHDAPKLEPTPETVRDWARVARAFWDAARGDFLGCNGNRSRRARRIVWYLPIACRSHEAGRDPPHTLWAAASGISARRGGQLLMAAKVSGILLSVYPCRLSRGHSRVSDYPSGAAAASETLAAPSRGLLEASWWARRSGQRGPRRCGTRYAWRCRDSCGRRSS